MNKSARHVREVAAKARLLSQQAKDLEAREMLKAVAKIFEAEADQILQKASERPHFH